MAIEYFQKTEEAAEKNEDPQAWQVVGMNLAQLYNVLAEYALSEFTKSPCWKHTLLFENL